MRIVVGSVEQFIETMQFDCESIANKTIWIRVDKMPRPPGNVDIDVLLWATCLVVGDPAVYIVELGDLCGADIIGGDNAGEWGSTRAAESVRAIEQAAARLKLLVRKGKLEI